MTNGVCRLIIRQTGSHPAIPEAALRPPRSRASIAAQTVFDQIRDGNRPALVGTIPGLNHKMEAAFRTGNIWVAHEAGQYFVAHVPYGQTMVGASWSDIGITTPPGQDQPDKVKMQEAHDAYRAWRAEIFAPASQPEVDFAQAAFRREFGRYGITLINSRTAQEVDHLGELLKRLPENVLKQEWLAKIDLDGPGGGGVRMPKYDLRTRGLRIFNSGNWDRHLYTKIALIGFGYAAFYTLTTVEKDKVKMLYDECRQHKVEFGQDPKAIKPWEQVEFQGLWDFFAVNFMHYTLLGNGMVGKDHWSQRGRLFDFYGEKVFSSKA